ncbi:MAG: 1-acyl-sn-glycerol-3-phosphate acyltransferase [Acidobacteria bacterium]|nr:1-acyl-sn-glycerol-3-phosphate acyltransferase [Acidobacteriota bacterium]
MDTALAALRTALTYLAIVSYTLLAGPVGLLIAVPFRVKGLLYDLGHVGVWMTLRTSGIRVTVEGREHLRPSTAVVFCANHQSNVDPPVLFSALHRRLHVLYKAELNRLPILGTVFQVGGYIPVPREQKEAALRAIELAAASIRQGNSFLVFPEGTRSCSDEMLPFKQGGFVMAIRAQAPVVPVAISGGRDAMRKGSALIYPAHVRVRIGSPVPTAGLTLDDRDALIATVCERIAAMLRQ